MANVSKLPIPVLMPPSKGEPYGFVQFGGLVVVHDIRDMEELTDRATVGKPLGPHGHTVKSIHLDGAWFAIRTDGRNYLVPVENVRSARK
jgi:hypothetical protein